MKAPRKLLAALLGGWALTVAGGLAWVQRYSAEPGQPASALSRWPEATSLARTDSGPQLILFAHPECPCTRATLRELERLLARTPGLGAEVVIVTADGADPAGSTIWSLATHLHDVAVIADRGGIEARRFGVATSGQVLLFDSRGVALFRGGLTSARGHEGEAPGQGAIADLIAGRPAPASTAVFGCSLL